MQMGHASFSLTEVRNEELIIIYSKLPSMDRAESIVFCFNTLYFIFRTFYLATFPYTESAPYFT